MNKSRRQELRDFTGSGRLRTILEMHGGLSHEAIDLLVDIALRYCEPKSILRAKAGVK